MSGNRIPQMLQAAGCAALALLPAGAAVVIRHRGEAARAENPLLPVYSPEIVEEAARILAPLMLAALALLCAGTVMSRRKNGKEPGRRPCRLSTDNPMRHRKPAPAAVQAVLLLAAAGLIIAGICNGSALDVLYKAVNLCAECIGLG